MDEHVISHQESLIKDSFSTIERLENEMATITREFESLDNETEIDQTSQTDQSKQLGQSELEGEDL